jgi:hypothetical protein
MTTRAKKRATKRSETSKAKSKRRSIPLTSSTAAMRKSQLLEETAARAPLANAEALNPAAMFGIMGRVTSAYAELPYRLTQCRSWMDLWKEQARFAQRILNVTEAPAPRRAPSRKQKPS